MKERLLSKIEKNEHGCWIWTGAIRNGYGCLKVNRKTIDAHRLSYKVFKGPIKEGLLVCHTCDTPSCINPDHLFIGTPKDNFNDALKKGRIKYNKNKKLLKHPSISAYNKRDCRCKECTELNRLKSISYRRRKTKSDITPH
jgi:hypothetical protein